MFTQWQGLNCHIRIILLELPLLVGGEKDRRKTQLVVTQFVCLAMVPGGVNLFKVMTFNDVDVQPESRLGGFKHIENCHTYLEK